MSAWGLLLWLVLAWPVAYVGVFSLAGALRAPRRFPRAQPRRLAVLIPAHAEDAVIVETARAALAHDYPSAEREVVVIAEALRAETLDELRALPLTLVEVAFAQSTKAKALQAGLAVLARGAFDGVVVLDADNVLAPGFLWRVSDALAAGCRALQGRRVAKNQDTRLARLDGLSEAINNHVFRRGHRALGLSAALIGSGMAFEAELFRERMQAASAVGGFDKELELGLLERGVPIEWLEDAVVFDEKVAAPEVFVRQRRRWLAAQLHYARRHLGRGLGALLTGRLDLADKILQLALPPRSLLLVALAPAPVAAAALGEPVLPWLGLLLTLGAALVLALPRTQRLPGLLAAALGLPRGALLMARALLGVRGANRRFLHTPHRAMSAGVGPKEVS